MNFDPVGTLEEDGPDTLVVLEIAEAFLDTQLEHVTLRDVATCLTAACLRRPSSVDLPVFATLTAWTTPWKGLGRDSMRFERLPEWITSSLRQILARKKSRKPSSRGGRVRLSFPQESQRRVLDCRRERDARAFF